MKKARVMEQEEKNYRMPIILLGGTAIICVILIILSYMSLHYAPVKIIMYDGYGIEAKVVAKNLRNENYENVAKTISLLEVKEQETVYENKNNYYIGVEKRKNIDLKYPIYINENAAVLNLSDEVNIITKNYEKVKGYENFIITEGNLYNAHDLSKADNNEYIFIETGEGTYVALKDIKIKTEVHEYVIPANSIINFTERYITYYQVEEDILVYKNILDVDANSIITIDLMEEQIYEEFLKKMEIIDEKITTNVPKKEKDEEEKGEIEESIEDKEEEEYIKPTLTVKEFETRVYTSKTEIQINDPQGRITQAIFIINKDNKTYQRRQIMSSGTLEITGLTPETEFEIEGKYRYYNEEKQEIEETFYKQTIKTKSIKDLGSIVVQHEPGEIFSKKIEIRNFGIENDINDEVIKGITKIEVEIDGINYNLSNEQIRRIKNKEKITYQTGESVKSNKNITYKIHFYDIKGNELEAENNKGKTRTSKVEPNVKVQIKTQGIDKTEIIINLNNKDNVKLENYYYVILENDKEIIREELKEKDREISRSDLDPNGYYKICFYADFDLNDEKGMKRGNKIGEATFTTMPLESLGNIFWKTEVVEIGKDSAEIKIQLDDVKTDNRLIQLIHYVEIIITDSEGNIVENYELNKEELKAGEEITEKINYLLSNTEYHYEIVTKIKQGSIEKQVNKEQTNSNFFTLKKSAEVLIKNKFITGELIDFDLKIQDEDGAILTNFVRMEIRDSQEKLIVVEQIKTNEEYERKQYDKLKENDTYTITFYAEQYNEGSSNETYQSNYILYSEQLVTKLGISGSIKLLSAEKKENGKNLVNVASKVNWISNSLFNNTSSYGKTYDEETKTMKISGINKYVYDLRKYAGQTVTISFQAKGTITGIGGVQIGKTGQGIKRLSIKSRLSSSTWTEFSRAIEIPEDPEEAYLGFYIQNGNVEFKEIQVELGEIKKEEIVYEEFKYQRQLEVKVNLNDENDEITTNDYYIRIYENDSLVQEHRYEEIGENNKVENIIKEFSDLNEGSKYRIELLIKIRDRFYTMDYYELEIKQDDEIKAISSKEEFLEIQPYGHYIVVNDLDFSNEKCSYTGAQWKGILDFNGHALIMDTAANGAAEIFTTVGREGIIENLVFEIRLNNTTELKDAYRIVISKLWNSKKYTS